VTRIDSFECNLGWRTISFLKITTDDGVVGWSEFSESFGNGGLGAVIRSLAAHVVGRDPMAVEALSYDLTALLRPARGGVNRQATAAIENALLDIKGKALGLPVSALLGGAVRDRVPAYWSHCGTYRLERFAKYLSVPAIATFDELTLFAKHVRERGFRALKTNVMALDDPEVDNRLNPYARAVESTIRFWDNRMIAAGEKTIAASREGAGDDCDIFFDANFNFEHEGYVRLERALRPWRPAWLEFDSPDADFVSRLRATGQTPIGSGESVYEGVDYRPFLQKQAFDVAIIDVPWNGYLESLKIAAQAQAHSVPVATHNFYDHLATAISAQFAAAVPNFHILEVDIDGVPWRDDLVTPPRFENGHLVVSELPGWGVEVNEEAILAHAASHHNGVHWL
jgi:galactonate dehydratase